MIPSESEQRVRLLFNNWLGLCNSKSGDVGCFLASAAAEFDDRPVPVRAKLLASSSQWMAFVASTFRDGIECRDFRSDFNPEQFAFDLSGIILAYHHVERMVGDAEAGKKAIAAFERLLEWVRAGSKTQRKVS